MANGAVGLGKNGDLKRPGANKERLEGVAGSDQVDALVGGAGAGAQVLIANGRPAFGMVGGGRGKRHNSGGDLHAPAPSIDSLSGSTPPWGHKEGSLALGGAEGGGLRISCFRLRNSPSPAALKDASSNSVPDCPLAARRALNNSEGGSAATSNGGHTCQQQQQQSQQQQGRRMTKSQDTLLRVAVPFRNNPVLRHK